MLEMALMTSETLGTLAVVMVFTFEIEKKVIVMYVIDHNCLL